uniref:Uncharacterized protein n=1 Tax=Avena sativa TaxID=4498 RepID=A0ACD5TGB3_AVESA
MQAGGTKTRFGRCPYCRAMICQNTSAAVYYCSKCRTPIRGKNTEPTDDEADKALSRLEILSAIDTASVFSDEELDASVIDVDGDQPPPLSCGYSSNSDANSQGVTASSPSPFRGGFSSPRDGTSRSNGCSPRGVSDNHVGSTDRQDEVRSVKNRVTELRVSSRRTRRASSASDPSILRRRDFSISDPEGPPRNAGEQQLRRSPMSSRELGTSVSMSGMEPSAVAASPLTDPAFQRDLLHVLDKLRGMLVSIELQPRAASSSALTRRESRIFRRMESQLARELPAAYAAEAHAPRRNARNYASGGSGSWSSASSSSGHGARPRKRHCFPLHGAAPFVVCGECSKLLQAPNSMAPSRRGVTKLRCGGCGEVLELRSAGIAAHARRASRGCSATRESGSGSCHGSDELERAASGGGGEQQVPPLLLYRALGFDSMSPLLHSQRY